MVTPRKKTGGTPAKKTGGTPAKKTVSEAKKPAARRPKPRTGGTAVSTRTP